MAGYATAPVEAVGAAGGCTNSWCSLDIPGPSELQVPLKPILRRPHTDPEALQLMAAGQPVVLTGTGLAAPLIEKWSLEHLRDQVNPKAKFLVKSSPGLFMHHDVNKNTSEYDFASQVAWIRMPFSEFLSNLDNPHTSAGGTRSQRMYLQESLTLESFGQNMANEFGGCNWAWALEMKSLLKFGQGPDNVIFVGEHGCVTHPHFDEQHNLFAQIVGRKRAILFSPVHWNKLYPHPVGHAADRQAQVDVYRPDRNKHPRFAEIEGMETVLEAGDVLYIPEMWFHMFENRHDAHTISVSYWFNIRGIDPVSMQIPLSEPRMLITVRRNLEKFTLNTLGGRRAAEFFKAWQMAEKLEGDFARHKEKLREMSGALIAASEVDRFLEELVLHRFDIPLLPPATVP